MACFIMKLRHLCFTVVLSSMAISCCKGQGGGAGGGAGGATGGAVVPGTQDAIQIVAQAALCLDNRQVINGCLQSMGINVNGNGNGNRNGNGSTAAPPALAPAPGPSASGTGTNNGSAASMLCQRPCFGQMMLMLTCVNGVLGNFQGYSPSLMQGVQAIFQMACGNVSNGQSGGAGGAGGGAGGGSAGGGASGGGGGGAGGTVGSAAVAASGSHVAVSNVGEPTSSAAGPTASLKSGFPSMLKTGNCIWLLLMFYFTL